MAKGKITLDSRGIREVLNSPLVAAAVRAKAVLVAASARRSGAEVVVDDYRTDRAASSVTVRDARAKGWVARDGLLIRDAAAAGLEVRARR